MLSPEYIPSHADHAFVLRQRGSTCVSTLSAGSISINLFDSTKFRGPSRQHDLVTRARNPTCVAFCFDLATYDMEDELSHPIQAALESFEYVTKLFHGRPVLLFLVNTSDFTRKLVDSPLSSIYADYTGDSPAAAREFILDKFQDANRAGKVYCHVCDVLDPSNLKFLFAAVEECVGQE